ncbi:hypothetical protein HZA85_00455 [Candidatus Uhrbacteria bacterium]|nr:hypothetical protein [Candidatus Uhrbacteria bacterium]
MPSASDLELAIFRTLCWFSVVDIPLTSFDVWKWLLAPCRGYELFEVDRCLTNSIWLSSRMDHLDGWYALKHKSLEQMLQSRRTRLLDASRKFKKLRRAAAFFQLLPGVRAVFAVNTLAWWHTQRTSDIDLFIVTAPGQVWSSRFFLVLPFLLAGARPHHFSHVDSVDPFCFSFFCASSALAFESLKRGSQDPYLAYWIKSVVPIFDRDGIADIFDEHNRWVHRLLPHARVRRPHPQHRPVKVPALPISGKMFEPVLRFLQRKKFPQAIQGLANLDTRVVISDEMLKFHENDRRQEFAQAFADTYSRLV